MKSRKLKNDDYVIEHGVYKLVEGAGEIAQSVESRLKLITGEYFLDLNDGLPLLTEILLKPVDIARVESVIKERITDTNEVARLISFKVDYDSDTRTLVVDFRAETILGATLTDQIGVTIDG